jgi:hypothetical protein
MIKTIISFIHLDFQLNFLKDVSFMDHFQLSDQEIRNGIEYQYLEVKDLITTWIFLSATIPGCQLICVMCDKIKLFDNQIFIVF